jgi:hypothetical protein
MAFVKETVQISGLKELSRAFKAADVATAKELRTTLRVVVEPVRASAESLAVQGIPKIGLRWSQMRIGITQTSVYLAPRQRGVRGGPKHRPNLAVLLLGRSMEPALINNQAQVIEGFDAMLGTVGAVWERA